MKKISGIELQLYPIRANEIIVTSGLGNGARLGGAVLHDDAANCFVSGRDYDDEEEW